MSKIFISYGDDAFKQSLKRIGKEAKQLGIFDKILLFTPKDLPLYIKSSPLMAFDRLGGYAIWKSYIIYTTYLKANLGDIIVYADAGCSLQKSDEWDYFLNKLGDDGTLLFQYRVDFDYAWTKCFGVNATVRNVNWMKKSVQVYFATLFTDNFWLETEKLWSGALIVKKGTTPNLLLEHWFKSTLLEPKLSIDIFGNELEEQDDTFVAHRHDQTLLSIFAFYFKGKQNIIFEPETAESQKDIAAIVASRLRDEVKTPFIKRIKRKVKNAINA
jgi:hypothetical protein